MTDFAENDGNDEMKKEAADAIKAVNAQYGYTPEFLSIGRQAGAVIASVDRIMQNGNLSTKMPDRLIYASAEIGQVIERSAGKQPVTVNPTREGGNAAPPPQIYHNAQKNQAQELCS